MPVRVTEISGIFSGNFYQDIQNEKSVTRKEKNIEKFFSSILEAIHKNKKHVENRWTNRKRVAIMTSQSITEVGGDKRVFAALSCIGSGDRGGMDGFENGQNCQWLDFDLVVCRSADADFPLRRCGGRYLSCGCISSGYRALFALLFSYAWCRGHQTPFRHRRFPRSPGSS